MHTQLNDRNVLAELYFYARNGLKEQIFFLVIFYGSWKIFHLIYFDILLKNDIFFPFYCNIFIKLIISGLSIIIK